MSNTLFKKVTATVAALSIVLSIVAPITGVKAADNDTEAANRLAALGVIEDRSSNPSAYNLGSSITRREMLKIMMNLSSVEVTDTCEGKFADLTASDWGCKYAEAALKAGFIAANPNFRPNDMVTEAESLKMIMQARGVAKAEGVADWADAYRQAAVEAGILSADAKVSSTGAAKRSMVIVSADTAVTNTTEASGDDSGDNLDDLFGDLFGDEEGTDVSGTGTTEDSSTGTTETGTDTSVTGGDLEVTLSPETPTTKTIPTSANGVEVLKFDVTAGSEDAKITQVVVKRTGLGANADFENVYLFNGLNRLTSGRTIATDSNTVTFPVNIVVKAGSTETLTVVGDLNGATANNQHTFAVESITTEGGSVTGTFPIVGNTLSIGGIAGGSLTIAKNSSTSDVYLGTKDAELANFKLTSGSTEDVTVQSVSLYNVGNCTSLSNIKLLQGGTVVGAGTYENNYLSFTLTSGNVITKGSDKIYTVTADVGSCRANDTVKIYIDNKADLRATGNTYGYNVSVTRTAYDNGSNDGTDASYSTVKGGQITVAFNGPSATQIAVNQTNVQLYKFSMTAGSNVEVRKMDVTLTSSDTNNTVDVGGLVDSANSVSNYKNIKIVDLDSGATVMGPKDLSYTAVNDGGAGDTTQTLTYQDSFSLTAGKTRNFAVVTDIANQTGLDSQTIKVTLGVFGSDYLKDNDTGLYVVPANDVVPNTSLAGNNMTVKTASLTAMLSSTPISTTVVKGSSTNLLGLALVAGDASDVKVTSIELAGYIDADPTSDAGFVAGSEAAADEAAATRYLKDVLPSVGLYDGSALVGTVKSISTDGTVVLNNLSLVVPKGTTKTLTLKGTFSTNAPYGTEDDKVGFSITAASKIAVEKVDGGSLTALGTYPINNTAASVAMTVTGNGVLSATVEGQPDAAIMIAGTSDILVNKYRFSATKEDIKVTKLTIINETAAVAVANPAVANAVDTSAVSQVKLRYTNSAGVVETKAGILSAGKVTISGIDLKVPKNGDAYVEILADATTMDVGTQALSGKKVRLVIAEDNSATYTEYVTQSSSVTTNAINASNDTNPNAFIVRKSAPKFAKQSVSSTALINSENTLYKFNVTSPVQGSVSLAKLVFPLTITDANVAGVSLTSFAIYRNGTKLTSGFSITNAAGADITATANPITASNSAVLAFTQEESISAGLTNTYELRATVAGASTGDSITAKISNGDESTEASATVTNNGNANTTYLVNTAATTGLVTAANLLTTVTAARDVLWSDKSQDTHVYSATAATSSLDFTNGYLLKVSNESAQTLTY